MAFVLAFIGAAVGLLIGIIIFSEVSDSISCPATGDPGTFQVSVFNVTSYDNLGTLGSSENAVYAEAEVIVDFLPPVTGRINDAVKQEGVQSLGGALNGEIYLGTTASDWWFLSGTGVGSDTISISMWINGDVQGSAEYPIISNFAPNGAGAGQTDGIYPFTDSGRMSFVIENNNVRNIDSIFRNATSPINSEPPDNSQWHLLTYSWDKSITAINTNAEYCLDGTVDNISTPSTREGCHKWIGSGSGNGRTENSWTAANVAPTQFLTIGSDGDHNRNSPFQVIENTFKVDDVGIWNGYRLTHTDVDNLWNGGSGASISSLAISPTTLRGYWNFDNATANGVTTPGGFVNGTEGGVGSAECESAKDTAWTVIGIIPVALFFALFAIFGAIGKPQ